MKLPDSLRSLRHRNLRLFFGGQSVSLVGTWMQSVAQSWLVWRLTRSEAALGLVGFLSQIPVLLLGPFGGAVADRLPRRTTTVITQSVLAVQALALAAVTLTGVVRPLHVYMLATVVGVVYAFDIPARQSLLATMAEDELGNAIALNSSIVNGARMVGPAVAGLVVAAIGEGLCFLGNGLSYLAIIVSLLLMRVPAETKPEGSAAKHMREGLRYAATTPHTRAFLGLLAASSVFGSFYLTLMPAFADHVLGGGAGLLGSLYAASGFGALVGATSLLRRRGLAGLGRRAAWGSLAFGVGLAVFASSRWTPLSIAALVVTGGGWMLQVAATNTLLQGLAPPELRGRIMGVYSSVFVGMAPLGALGAGWLADRIGAARTTRYGGLVIVAAALAFLWHLPDLRRIVRRDFPEQFVVQELE